VELTEPKGKEEKELTGAEHVERLGMAYIRTI
jgi:hypothetical protein